MPGLNDIFTSFRIQDVLDILIVWTAVYGLLVWFKRTRSRFVLAGIGLIGIIYLMSRWFQLYMTAFFLQSIFAVLVFGFIVLFQEELRRFFERLAMWGGSGKGLL